MNETLLLSRNGQLVPISDALWKSHLAQAPAHAPARLSFMTPAHHRLRYFVVQELPRFGAPLPPELLAWRLDIPLPEISRLLDDLERHLFFLVRNEQGAVAWAYPVTAEPTPHRLTFSSGERLYAA
jgi:hypothetical protein